MSRFFLLSDTHFDASAYREDTLRQAMKQIFKLDPAPLIVDNGDLTDRGRQVEWDGLKRVLGDYPQATFLCNLGNHDVRGPNVAEWTKDPGQDPAYFHDVTLPAYLPLSENLTRPKGAWYGTYETADALFVMMNLERGLKDAASLSQAQLDWLFETLEAATKTPLVFIHQPLNDTHWRGDLFGGFGVWDEALKEVLRKFPQALLFSGHNHNGLGTCEVIPRSFGTLIDLPAFGVSEIGYRGAGVGYAATLSPEALTLEAWDFTMQRRLAEFDQVVALPTLAAAWPGPDVTWRQEVRRIWDMHYDQSLFHIPGALDVCFPPRALYGSQLLDEVNALSRKAARRKG